MSRIWAITTYYNPSGYQRREQNYRVFREHLGLPLAVIELSFNGEFFLTDSDADLLVQIDQGDVMWQKERLINRIVQELPEECEYVAWVDADVVFQNSDWPEMTIKALQNHGLVHLFRQRLNLLKDESCEDVLSGKLEFDPGRLVTSSIYLNEIGEGTEEDFAFSNSVLSRGTSVGLAWASTRHILEHHGLFDACILGSGDRVMVNSAFGNYEWAENAATMTPGLKRYYRNWCEGFHQAIRGRMCHVPGLAIHLWHGEMVDRKYVIRHEILNRHDYDPAYDIGLNQQGVFEWTSDKPEMHAEIAAYFDGRKDDG